VVVADIGIKSGVLDEIVPDTFENDPRLWMEDLPWLNEGDNKYNRGHALISTIAVPEIAFPLYAAAVTSIMIRSLASPADFDLLLDDRRFSALLIGPGAGADDETRKRTLAMLASGRPTVIDADAITAFEDNPSELDQAICGPCVLTPHNGEFGRLFDPRGDKLARTRVAARRSGAIIVLKGSDTVITAPDGRSIINRNAPPTLATAGSGDVLSGIILGLLAQGMEPFLAAAAGVWLHGAAATEFGPGLIAEDLPDLLPGVLRHLYGRSRNGRPGPGFRQIPHETGLAEAKGSINRYACTDTEEAWDRA
jgi:NAD(P)H-hydrate epimerase